MNLGEGPQGDDYMFAALTDVEFGQLEEGFSMNPQPILGYSGLLLPPDRQFSAIVDQEVDEFQSTMSMPSELKEAQGLQSSQHVSPQGTNMEVPANLYIPPFTCKWKGCSAKAFTRKSDLRKHWERHTKPYVCQELGCNAITFGDKASLRRHETEKHAKHDAKRYLCPVESCPRASKGFPRKRNRDAHLTTHHMSSVSVVGNGAAAESVSELLEPVAGDDLGVIPRCEGEAEAAIGDVRGLELKMKELEREKSVLDFRRNRVEEDIAALQRVMQLIATTNGSKDIVALGLEHE
ncbi:hypothetical protein L207DRAFT_642762 [Hyaloscypha variabilis F]|uniref:C2H2-type domain-containing protein n=1 Tax=Hyaloscypha variabilis (strain UAMH 11265 / GT02V1 / F) TaxID=1149755 RepID=A0A2J6QRS2_HYAVF|nr:hypothetical protein L207DRAFT_642762 [Hyaloscypha variabilis F]